ncbi:MAG: transcription elongation factor GreB [Bdellovibrionaceae bacterium]|nr:transcription elongation factor GreB [Pseudobdellovibrionaceae bacterium]
MSKKNYITPEGAEKLKAEYNELFHGERPKLVETVAWAASNGDRSENADYQYGKKRLREIDRRLKFLMDRLDAVEIIDVVTVKSDRVVFGATVTYTNEEGESFTYQIVGEDEFDIKKNKISWKSPLAAALLGKKQGDEVRFTKPNGEEDFLNIEEIEYK